MTALTSLRRILPAALGGTKGTKSLTSVVHDGRQLLFDRTLLPETTIDYAQEMGDGLGSSVLAGPLNFMCRTFPEAPPIVEVRAGEQWAEEPGHALTTQLRRPNPFYGGRTLWMATVLDLCFGNAYWLKLRNSAGQVVQLWWVPRQLMVPRWPRDGSVFISHYDYLPGGRRIPVDVNDVVHFRFGIDPRNPRLGLSPLGALVREVVMDDHAANFAATILKNLGIVGLVISPKEKTGPVGKEALEEVKQYLKQQFTGDQRGTPLALGAPTEVQLLQYNMQGFDVSPLRDVSEERVCAALGIPAAVVGFGTGLQQTKVGATMKEMRQLAWTGGLIPMQELVADEIDRTLLPDFGGDDGARMRFDTSKVRALWEDQNEKDDRVRKNYLAGVVRRDEARRALGLPADETDHVFVQPVNVVQLGPDGTPIPTTTPAPAPAPAPEDPQP